ncbi:Fic family protein [Pseudomonas hormoni]
MMPGKLRDEAQKNVFVGDHAAPGWESVGAMIARMKEVYGRPRILGANRRAVAFHHRLAFTHPFKDGNGRLIRMMTHLQLVKIGLGSPLWSISRGLARRRDDYYAKLRAADQPRRGDLDGRGQLTQAGLINFVRFMLEVCKEQAPTRPKPWPCTPCVIDWSALCATSRGSLTQGSDRRLLVHCTCC